MQTRAVSAVALCALRMQEAWLRQHRVLGPRQEAVSEGVLVAEGGGSSSSSVVTVFFWQWDETSQRVKGLVRVSAAGESVSNR